MQDVYIRLCQFHVIQAITRWDGENGGRGIGFTLSEDMKFEICAHFRVLQRCRTWDDWPEAKRVFYVGLKVLLSDELDSEDNSGDMPEAKADKPEEDTVVDKPLRTAKSKKKPPPPPKPKTKAAKASGLTCFEAVQAYFEKNWFVERWICEWTSVSW